MKTVQDAQEGSLYRTNAFRMNISANWHVSGNLRRKGITTGFRESNAAGQGMDRILGTHSAWKR
jgi:hypothetical protein